MHYNGVYTLYTVDNIMNYDLSLSNGTIKNIKYTPCYRC